MLDLAWIESATLQGNRTLFSTVLEVEDLLPWPHVHSSTEMVTLRQLSLSVVSDLVFRPFVDRNEKPIK